MTAHPELKEYKANLKALDGDLEEGAVYYYYDDQNNWIELRHKRGDMPGTDHSDLVDYLMQVLLWLYRVEQYGIYRELNFYQTDNPLEKPLYPDLALLKSQKRQKLLSYKLGGDNPAPELIIEIISTKTRQADLTLKPKRYQKWGTLEYFTYDPRPRRHQNKEPRLRGWRLNKTGSLVELIPASDGRMWCEQLECWLIPDDQYLRLYDRKGQKLLTEAEAEHQRAERLAEILRRMGRDPDQL
jgi:Uma2 family endonuclease